MLRAMQQCPRVPSLRARHADCELSVPTAALHVIHGVQALEAGGSGRAIVFTNYREGVMGICEALRQHEPLITARQAWGGISHCALAAVRVSPLC